MTGIQIQPSVSSVRGLPQALDSKVSKVEGKSLVDNSEIAKLATVEEGATNTSQYTDEDARNAVAEVGYLTSFTESDPIFNASQAKNITAGHIVVLNSTTGTNTGDQDLSGKQDLLVSGTNIKTINGTSLLGSGNITIEGGSSSAFKYGRYSLSATQTSNFAVGNHVQFNVASGSLGGLATGSGQANGIITLTGGKSYKITAGLYVYFSASGFVQFQLYNRTNSQILGSSPFIVIHSVTFTGNAGNLPHASMIITPSTNIDIDLRISAVQSLSEIEPSTSFLLIEEYTGA